MKLIQAVAIRFEKRFPSKSVFQLSLSASLGNYMTVQGLGNRVLKQRRDNENVRKKNNGFNKEKDKRKKIAGDPSSAVFLKPRRRGLGGGELYH